jgi:hypothetical protein
MGNLLATRTSRTAELVISLSLLTFTSTSLMTLGPFSHPWRWLLLRLAVYVSLDNQSYATTLRPCIAWLEDSVATTSPRCSVLFRR